VLVRWLDASLDHEANALLDDKEAAFGELYECEDIGFLYRKTKREVVLALSRCITDNSVRHATTIPAKWILSISILSPSVVERTFPQEPPLEVTPCLPPAPTSTT